MASVIKASGPVHAADGMSFNFDDMTVKANQYLEQVKIEAGKIVVAAKQEAAAIKSKAEAEGKQAAQKAVEKILDEKIHKQMASLLPALSKAVESINHAKHSWLQHWEKTAVHVAAAIASRVIRREVSKSPEITVALVKEALELAAGSAEINVRLNPGDHAALAGQVQTIAASLTRLGQANVIADPNISAGGCRVDTRFGTIDQQFEAQLSRIEKELS
jgi:flagellar assembly protein FliH